MAAMYFGQIFLAEGLRDLELRHLKAIESTLRFGKIVRL
jgi:hypothetical protein